MVTKISKSAQIAGLLVCLAGILAFLVGIFHQHEMVIEEGKWAIRFGVCVLLGGTASRALARIVQASALDLARGDCNGADRNSLKTSSKKTGDAA